MNRLLWLCAPVVFAAACAPREEALRSGDLIFVGIPADYRLDAQSMGSAISEATADGSALNLIHTAILEIDAKGGAWIIDATIKHGVDRHPLDTFLRDFTLRDGSLPVFELMRLRDDARAEEAVERAKCYVGRPYDTRFAPSDSALYCTELVRDCYLAGDGTPLFPAEPMNFKNDKGEFPLYWQQLFALLGEPIPQGVPGTNPQALAKDPALRRINATLSRR